MAIDPELRELTQELRALTQEARAAGGALAGVRAGSGGVAGGASMLTGGVALRSGGHARDSFSGRTAFAGWSWRQQKRDVRDVADVAVGMARGDYAQVAQGITGLAPKSLLKGYLAIQAIRYGVGETIEGIKAVSEEADRKRDLIKKMNDAGLLTTAMDARALQSMYLDKEMGKMSRWQNGLGPGTLRDSMVTPINFLSSLVGFQAYDTSREIIERADEAADEAMKKIPELQETYFSQARLGNLRTALDASAEMGKLVGSGRNKWLGDNGSPAEVWYRYDQAKIQNRLWSATESPRAGPRSEVD